jgi:hypothetical protein
MKFCCGKRFGGATIVAGLAAILAGCASVPEPASAPAGPSITADMLVGNWGLASYHKDADRARTETAARAQCNKPYVISRGPSGGVMMYLADQPQAQELVVKRAGDGKTYVGPAGDPPGGDLDREVISFDNGVFVTQWVDPEVVNRYGTMVFARCASK